MPIIDWLSLIILTLLSVMVFYLYCLAIFGIIGGKKYLGLIRKYDFLVLVPAHNEEPVIEATLKSLKKLEATGRLEIVVIADNCSDSTAAIARGQGVKVFERTDSFNQGKGFTLEWGIKQVNLDEYDAVAVVDADTLVEPGMLKAMCLSFEAGYKAVQVCYELFAMQDTPPAQLQYIANAAENIYFYNGRSVLGLPILLRGTGMGIKTDILKAHPFDSHSITEDADFAIDLLKDGAKIDFNMKSTVRSAAASSYEQSYSQKFRWASGAFTMITRRMIPLAAFAVSKGRPDLLELAFSFLLLSRPALIYLTLIPIMLGLLSSSVAGFYFIFWGLILAVLLIVYLLSGIFHVKEKRAALKGILHLPYYGPWFMILQMKAFFGRKQTKWVRTERKP